MNNDDGCEVCAQHHLGTGSGAGCYFVVAHDGKDWFVVGLAVAGGDGWVAGRWTDRAAAVADAERWTQLAAAVSAT